jgi:hypothetical protein
MIIIIINNNLPMLRLSQIISGKRHSKQLLRLLSMRGGRRSGVVKG